MKESVWISVVALAILAHGIIINGATFWYFYLHGEMLHEALVLAAFCFVLGTFLIFKRGELRPHKAILLTAAFVVLASTFIEGYFVIKDIFLSEEIIEIQEIKGEIFKVEKYPWEKRVLIAFKDGRILSLTTTHSGQKEMLFEKQFVTLIVGKERSGRLVLLQIQYPQGFKSFLKNS